MMSLLLVMPLTQQMSLTVLLSRNCEASDDMASRSKSGKKQSIFSLISSLYY